MPVGLFFSTLLDWFCDDFVEISGSVSSATLGIGLGAFSAVSAALTFSTLPDWLYDCNDTGCSGIVRFFALRVGCNLETTSTGTSDSFPFLCVVDATLFSESSGFSFSCLVCLKRVSSFFFLVTVMKGSSTLRDILFLKLAASILLFVPGASGFRLHSA